MTPRTVTVRLDARDPGRLAHFWSTLLDREELVTPDGVLLPGGATQVGLRFVPAAPAPPAVDRLHLHLTSTGAEGQRTTVERALGLGAAHLDVGQRPEEEHVVLADPEGNPFCVIEPGNRFLAGCGFLGEVACDGSPAVGRFWAAALGWPLVWDSDGETAVQSPSGGTKVAWGGPSDLAPGPSRQRLELASGSGDQAAELGRLVALGAEVLHRAEGGAVVLADPDGAELVSTTLWTTGVRAGTPGSPPAPPRP